VALFPSSGDKDVVKKRESPPVCSLPHTFPWLDSSGERFTSSKAILLLLATGEREVDADFWGRKRAWFCKEGKVKNLLSAGS